MIWKPESLQLSRQVQRGYRFLLHPQVTIPKSTMSSPLTNAIAGLSSGEASARGSAAAEIYAAGRAPADRAVEEWWSNEELSALLLRPNTEITVGLAVQRETFAKIRAANDVTHLAEVPSDQDAEEFELHFEGGISLDILTSRAPGGDGAIARYLEKFGEGVQQVEFQCLNVDRATEILKERFDAPAVYPETRAGANGTRVNFFLVPMPGAGKVLIELSEPSSKNTKQ